MINGGFFKKTKENQYPSVVIGVGNIREAMKKVRWKSTRLNSSHL